MLTRILHHRWAIITWNSILCKESVTFYTYIYFNLKFQLFNVIMFLVIIYLKDMVREMTNIFNPEVIKVLMMIVQVALIFILPQFFVILSKKHKIFKFLSPIILCYLAGIIFVNVPFLKWDSILSSQIIWNNNITVELWKKSTISLLCFWCYSWVVKTSKKEYSSLSRRFYVWTH